MGVREQLNQLVRQRLAETAGQRAETRTQIYRGKPLGAEPDPSRAQRFAFRRGIPGPEALQGDTVDFLPTWYLTRGADKARAVGLVRVDGLAQGTGFLISPSLFITNNHVLEHKADAAQFTVVFNYEVNTAERLEATTEFRLDPDRFWLTSGIDNLDYTIVAVGTRVEGKMELKDFGYLPLSDRPDKHALGICVNIVQHPLGRRKQVVIRENRLLARGAERRTLHYSADTEEGSSGSPVFNDDWDVVALHHWGVPHLDTVTINGTPVPQTVNEGVRASAIVAQLKEDLGTLTSPEQQRLLGEALLLGEKSSEALTRLPLENAARGETRISLTDEISASNPPVGASSTTSEQARNFSCTSAEVVQTVNLPLEVRIRLATESTAPGAAAAASTMAPRSGRAVFLDQFAERVRIDRDYSNRNGFSIDFIDGASVSLADIVRPRASEIAELLDGSGGVDALLKYQNFSLYACAKRGLALLTATNIDAERYIEIDRDTGLPKAGPEGESWFNDDRIDPRFCVGQDFYRDWSVYFDHGHLTRRSDPTWGTAAQAIRANADTFHFTNCSPQHFRFNQSFKYWQGVERYILEFGALKTHSRVTVLTGPVLNDHFRDYGGVQVPLQFWKVVVRMGLDGKPQASALMVSQERLLEEKRVVLKPPSSENAPKVDEYRVSIAYLANLTGLDFSYLGTIDTFKSAGREEAPAHVVSAWSDLL